VKKGKKRRTSPSVRIKRNPGKRGYERVCQGRKEGGEKGEPWESGGRGGGEAIWFYNKKKSNKKKGKNLKKQQQEKRKLGKGAIEKGEEKKPSDINGNKKKVSTGVTVKKIKYERGKQKTHDYPWPGET